jgi:hypothetical protein
MKVQTPTSLKVLSSSQVLLANFPNCTFHDYGAAVAIHFQVLDQSGTAIASASMVPQEEVLNEIINGIPYGNPEPNWGDLAPNAGQSSKYTDASGQSGTIRLESALISPSRTLLRSLFRYC